MSSRPLRTLASATSTIALVAAGIAATTSSAGAAPGDVDTQLCVGQPVWTGGFTAGQPVTGKTTVEGNVLSDFQGTYVDTIADAYGNDIHLFDLSGSRITGGHLGQGPAGIWSGISGSPVYDLDGNLVGSVSYSFTGVEGSTLAGITPAANLLKPDPTAPDPVVVPLSAAEKTTLKKAGVAGASKLQGAKPLAPQRVVTGVDADRANALVGKSRVLRDLGGRDGATYAPASVIDDSELPDIAPGGNIATTYAYGQITLASVGTVTAVCGDKVYAFGHPDENMGESTQTILKAKTLAIVSDGPNSYKMVNVGSTPAGSLTSDNTNGISGTLGTTPESALLTTHTTANGKPPVDRVSHVSTPYALPLVVGTQIANDALNAFKKDGAGDAESTITIKFMRSGRTALQTYKRTIRVSSPESLPGELSFAVASEVETILGNGFEDVTITSVDVNTKYLPTYRAYKIRRIQYLSGGVWKNSSSTGKIRARRGATIKLRVQLAADRGSRVAPATIETAWKTSRSKKKSGAFSFYGQSFTYDDEEYFSDEDDYEDEYNEEEDLASLDELLWLMRSTPPGDDVLARYRYNTKAGKSIKFKTVRGPGLVTGSKTVRLSYK